MDHTELNCKASAGAVSACIVFTGMTLLDRLDWLDDPCCTALVHAGCGVWGLLAVGIFAQQDIISEVDCRLFMSIT